MKSGAKVSNRHEGDESSWQLMIETLQEFLYEPDVEAVRAAYAAIAAHDLTNGQPVWAMLVAPPGSAKTTILEPLRQFPYVYPIDKLTPNTFLSGQIGQKHRVRKPSLLHRIGPSGIVIFADFSTVLGMKADDKATILADLRRIFDGHLRKEVGTTEDVLEWEGRVTCAVAVTPDVDRHYGIFQSLGERFVMIRWRRAGGEEDAEQAAIKAMNQDPTALRECLNAAVAALFDEPLPKDIDVPNPLQNQIAALAEFVVRARTHVPRDNNKHLAYMPEAEAPTRLSQQLSQLAKGSARLSRRTVVNEDDFRLVKRVGFDCIPSLRWRVLQDHIDKTESLSETIPKATLSYTRENLQTVGLLQKEGEHFQLSPLSTGLLKRAIPGSLNLPSERVKEKEKTEGVQEGRSGEPRQRDRLRLVNRHE